MYYLYSLLQKIDTDQIEFLNSIIPSSDINPDKSHHWTWNWYSDIQKVNRITMFFYYHQISYLKMVETNFPSLSKFFSRYSDAPYQNIILVDLKKTIDPKEYFSEPSMTYYYISSPTHQPILPEVRFIDNDYNRSDRNEIYNEIKTSYFNQGLEAKRLGYTLTGFTFTTTSRSLSVNLPLSDYVYASIKSSIEEVFGRL